MEPESPSSRPGPFKTFTQGKPPPGTRGDFPLPQSLEDSSSLPLPNVTSESQICSLDCSHLQAELGAMSACDRSCPGPSVLESRRSSPQHHLTVHFSKFDVNLWPRLVFVSPYFVFFFMMNGYCQASLEEVIGRRRGAGRRQHSGGGLGGVCVGFLVGLLLTFLFIG